MTKKEIMQLAEILKEYNLRVDNPDTELNLEIEGMVECSNFEISEFRRWSCYGYDKTNSSKTNEKILNAYYEIRQQKLGF